MHRPTAVAIIPARGGSKGVPRKNVEVVGGLPLVVRSIRSCLRAGLDAVVVSTDDDEIARVASSAGARVVWRPPELATDTATSEAAILHAVEADEIAGDAGVLAFVQCTSPFLSPAHLEEAVKSVAGGRCEVAFSAVPSHSFLWRLGADGAFGVNHHASERQRRQDRPVEFRETGAFYVFGADGFKSSGHRFYGRILPIEVPELHSIEIDEPGDLFMARLLSSSGPIDDEVWPSLGDLDALVMDFDGVHTDNTALIGQEGGESALVNRSDGLGIAMAHDRGLRMLVLSTETNPIVQRRCEKLRLQCVHGSTDKKTSLADWADRHGLDRRRIAYVGNDVNDLGCLRWVGHPIVVADAHLDVSALGALTTSAAGGQGAVREVIDRILRSVPSDEGARK